VTDETSSEAAARSDAAIGAEPGSEQPEPVSEQPAAEPVAVPDDGAEPAAVPEDAAAVPEEGADSVPDESADFVPEPPADDGRPAVPDDDAPEDSSESETVQEPEPVDPLDAMRERIEIPDDALSEQATERQATLIKPVGSLGQLEGVATWFTAAQGHCPPHDFARPRVIVFAGDHGVAAAGVSAYPAEATAQLFAAMLAGGAPVNVLADAAGATIRLVDMAVDADTPGPVSTHKVRRGSGRIDRENALTSEETQQAFDAGVAIADEEIDGGADLLILADLGVANTTPAAVLIAVCLGLEPTAVTGRGSGIDDATWMRKVVVVRNALRRGRNFRYETLELLGCSGGADIAAMTGFLLQASVRRTPVVLDGVVSAAAAMVARDTAYDASSWWFASHKSTEPAHVAALESLGLEPLLNLGIRLGQGTGALVALPLIRAAVRTLGEVSTLAEAGVNNKATPPAPEPRRRPARPARKAAPSASEAPAETPADAEALNKAESDPATPEKPVVPEEPAPPQPPDTSSDVTEATETPEEDH
jgi:nicotinate-nucleotide--dimethylbenzimidazole phosphoribosyltransferase